MNAPTTLLDKIGAARLAIFNGLTEAVLIECDGTRVRIYRQGEEIKVEFL